MTNEMTRQPKSLAPVGIVLMLMLLVLAVAFGAANLDHPTLVCSVGVCLLAFSLVMGALRNICSITFLFLAFWMLYVFVGPAAVLFGTGLNEYYFPRPYYTAAYLAYSSVAVAAFALGFYKVPLLCGIRDSKAERGGPGGLDPASVGVTAVVFALAATVLEGVNFIRVGGLATAMLGKAAYQSAVSDLSLTLPSSFASYVAFGLLGLYAAARKRAFGKLAAAFLVCYLPYLTLLLVVGYRGVLLGDLLVLLLGYNYRIAVTRLKPGLIIAAAAVFFLLIVISSGRGIAPAYLEQGDYTGLASEVFSQQRMDKYLNLSNEYGVAFGNFNLYYQSNLERPELIYGRSYLTGLGTIVPSFLYPGNKPDTILYEFRDVYMPFERKRGSIASHGFSFLLEAYINFGMIGVALVHFLLGRLFVWLEHCRVEKSSYFLKLLYITCISFATSLPRSHFGNLVSCLSSLLAFIALSKAVYHIVCKVLHKSRDPASLYVLRIKSV